MPVLQAVKGFEFIEPDTVIVYHDYVHPVSSEITATHYVPWPKVPWEIMEAAGWLVVNGGPLSGLSYDWRQGGGVEQLDLTNPVHAQDLVAWLEGSSLMATCQPTCLGSARRRRPLGISSRSRGSRAAVTPGYPTGALNSWTTRLSIRG